MAASDLSRRRSRASRCVWPRTSTCGCLHLSNGTCAESRFNAVRVPTSPADIPLAYDPSKNHHVVVLCNDRYWKVDTRGRSASQLAEAFKQIKEKSKGKAGSGVGILTADDRDVWTEVSLLSREWRRELTSRRGDTSCRFPRRTRKLSRTSNRLRCSYALTTLLRRRRRMPGRGTTGQGDMTARARARASTGGSTSTRSLSTRMERRVSTESVS